MNFATRLFRFNLALGFLEGFIVLWLYVRTPSESGVAVLWGFSSLRLLMLLFIVFILCVLSALLVFSFAKTRVSHREQAVLARFSEDSRWFWLLLLALGLTYVYLFASEHYLGVLVLHRQSLRPILTWFGLLALQGMLSWLILRAHELPLINAYRDVLLPSAMAFVSVGAVLLLIATTKIGLKPDSIYWQEAGVPVLFSQILFVAILGIFLQLLPKKVHKRGDTYIFFALWAIALILWSVQDARSSYNTLGPLPPNYQYYPFGDAMLYDVTAQGYLAGKAIPADFWVKPLYSFFLSILHLIADQDYVTIVFLQIAFLAFIPAFVYLVTRLLGGRVAGIIAAMLVIVREWNALKLSNVIQVSHSKLLLSDLFAMGGMVVLVWLLLHWLEQPHLRRATPIAVGGSLGLLILLRGHPILLVPFLFLTSFIFLRKQKYFLWESAIRLTAGLALVLLPWFLYTFNVTGRIVFQDNSSSFASKDEFVRAYADPSMVGSDSYGQFESQLLRMALERPVEVAQFVLSHHFHNTVFSYIYLPQSLQIESLKSYVKRQPFWVNWNGGLSAEAWFLLFINGAILALGFGSAWKKTRGLVFVPLIMGTAYNLSVAVSRRSGWRFILPADWISLIFYAIGIVQFIVIIRSILKRSMDRTEALEITTGELSMVNHFRRSPILISLSLLFIPSFMVLGYKLFPVPYPAKNASQIVQLYGDASRGTGIDFAELEQFMQNEHAVAIYGRALYPVYLKANQGALNYSWLSFAAKPYERLAFHVLGDQSAGVILPVNLTSMNFPDGSDVIVIGCLTKEGYIDALTVLIRQDPPIVYTRQPATAGGCPLPEPE